MVTKLTLTLDNKIIEQTKIYAHQNKISLSKLVEIYFRSLSATPERRAETIPPITRKLSGIAGLSTGKSDKELLQDALSKRFL
jgi:hypothetical protein